MRDDLRIVDMDYDVLTVEDFTRASDRETSTMLLGIDCSSVTGGLQMVDLDPGQVRTLVDHLRACLHDIGEDD